MIIYLTTIETRETKFIIESKYKDMIFSDIARSPEQAVTVAQEQIKLINFFRGR